MRPPLSKLEWLFIFLATANIIAALWVLHAIINRDETLRTFNEMAIYEMERGFAL